MAKFLSYLSPAYAFGQSRKNQQDPFAAAQPYIQNQREMYERNFSPYTEAGRSAVGNVSNIYERMASDPTAFYNHLASSYTPQKGYDDYRNTELMKVLRDRARTGGYENTQYDRESQARLFNELLEADEDKWYSRVSGLLGTGLQGQSNLANLGYNATNSLSQGVGNTYDQEAQLAYQSQAQKNHNRNSLIRALLGGAGAVGGAFLGGPAGAAAGANLGSALGGGFSGSYGGGGSLDTGSWNTGRR